MSVCLCELILTKTWKQTNECLFMWININKNLKTDEWVFVHWKQTNECELILTKTWKQKWVFVYVSICSLILTKTWKQTNECLFMWVNINKNLKTDEWVFVYVN